MGVVLIASLLVKRRAQPHDSPAERVRAGVDFDSGCAAFGVPYIKAVKIAGAAPDDAVLGYHARARGLLLDVHDPVAVGGTGRAFDWSLAPVGATRPIILAGGLHAQNVAAAIRQVRPFAVDVSSGVEVSPGIKDGARIREFMRAVAAVNAAPGD